MITEQDYFLIGLVPMSVLRRGALVCCLLHKEKTYLQPCYLLAHLCIADFRLSTGQHAHSKVGFPPLNMHMAFAFPVQIFVY